MLSPRLRGESSLIKPEARVPINIRLATPGSDRDFAFIDGLQKRHSKALGFMPRAQLEAYIAAGDVLVAERGSEPWAVGFEQETESQDPRLNAHSPELRAHSSTATPLGYIISRDRYFKRDDVGIIYQLVVGEAKRRSLVGAMLVQAMFEKAAYGCRLFCCWCAQDLEANHFWESIGFVPLAFRAGSSTPGRQRLHIFWQKRIRAEEQEGYSGQTAAPLTPWWIPSMTSGGAMREDRLAIPIPPETHWSDAKPILLPEIPGVDRFIEEQIEVAPPGQGQPVKQLGKKKPRKPKAAKPARRGLWFVEAPPGRAPAPGCWRCE